MTKLLSVCLLLVSLSYYCCTEFLICRNTGDDLTVGASSQSCKETTNRLKVLEEQVRQLRSVIDKGGYTDRRTKYPDMTADCGEIFANRTIQSGVYMISPDGRCPFSVYCDMTDDGWTVIQRRIDGTVNFYRTWDEYVQGFGNLDGEYWLDLEKIHRLTKEGAEIYFDIEHYDGSKVYAHYTTFNVHSATTLYKMNVDAIGYAGTIEELFSAHDCMVFSTFDRDNDAHKTGSCVKDHNGGGWWYKSCYTLGNLNSIFGVKAYNGLNYHSDLICCPEWTSVPPSVKILNILANGKDCGEIFANGKTQSDVYMISPDGRCPFSVYCDMTDDGWTVIQRRLDGAVNFYRTWEEYVQGFGDLDGEYWLGLEKIHRLTKEGAEIYFDIEHYDGSKVYAHYKTFTVHSATTLYKMNVDAFGYDGTIEELFSIHDGMKFSTFDRENDIHKTVNCVKNHNGGGWWYTDCYRLGNLNSIFGVKAHNGLNYHNKTQYVFVKTVVIKIRAKRGFC